MAISTLMLRRGPIIPLSSLFAGTFAFQEQNHLFQPTRQQVRNGISYRPRYLPKIKKSHPLADPNLQVILLKDIEGIGSKGSLAMVDKKEMRLYFHPAKMAVYATTENLLKHGIRPEHANNDEFRRESEELKEAIHSYNSLNGVRLVFERSIKPDSLTDLEKPLTKRDVCLMLNSLYGLDTFTCLAEDLQEEKINDVDGLFAAESALHGTGNKEMWVQPVYPVLPGQGRKGWDKPEGVLRERRLFRRRQLKRLCTPSRELSWDDPFIDQFGWFKVVIHHPSHLVIALKVYVDVRPVGSSELTQLPDNVIFNYTRDYEQLLAKYAGITEINC